MFLIFDDMTRRTLAVFNFRLRTSVSSILNCQGVQTGSQLRHSDSIFIILDGIQICFHAKVTLNVTIGSQDRVTVNVLNLFCPHIDEPIPDSHLTFRFEFRWWTINIKKICIDHFANISNPCREAYLMYIVTESLDKRTWNAHFYSHILCHRFPLRPDGWLTDCKTRLHSSASTQLIHHVSWYCTLLC